MDVLRDVTKYELRAKLFNPTLDLDSPGWENKVVKIKSIRNFRNEVFPVVQQYCNGIITLAEFKRRKTIPAKVANVILSKLL